MSETMTTPPAQPGLALRVLLAIIAVMAVVVPTVIVLRAPPVVPHRHHRRVFLPARIVPPAEIPPVEPVAFEDMSMDEAREFNASIPFVDGPNPAARPFKFAGSSEQRARAADCLAVALLYEAGDDAVGQRAVAQVIVNRARHPAFPKTICGVVFQGSERSTGCQFSFTCDNAMNRHHFSDAAWVRARALANMVLNGATYAPVGYATHYHTDWVVPYWQSSLDKIVAVHTHLFFRWTGWWGTPGAFAHGISSDEPIIPALAQYSEAHKGGGPLTDAAIIAATTTAVTSSVAPIAGGDNNSFLITLDPKMQPEAFAAIASRACGDRPYCKVMGWTDKSRVPTALPLQQAQVATMSFSYLRDRPHGFDKALWNCAEFRRADLTQCMKLQVLVPVTRQQADGFKLESLPGARRTPTPVAPAGGLSGVRMKADTTPAAKPTPVAKATPMAKATPEER
jgi:spore germination cell wall hydrolase CwlJ-like protein